MAYFNCVVFAAMETDAIELLCSSYPECDYQFNKTVQDLDSLNQADVFILPNGEVVDRDLLAWLSIELSNDSSTKNTVFLSLV